jgi:hypothetical protein
MKYVQLFALVLIVSACNNSPHQSTPPAPTSPADVTPQQNPPDAISPTAQDTTPPPLPAQKPDASSNNDNVTPNPDLVKALQKQKFDPTRQQKLEEIDLPTICDFFDEQRAIALKEIDTSDWKKFSLPSKRLRLSFKAPRDWKLEKRDGFDEIPEIQVILPPLRYMGHGVHFHWTKINWLDIDDFDTKGCVKKLSEDTWSFALFKPQPRLDLPDNVLRKIYKKTATNWIAIGYTVDYFSSQVTTSEFIRQKFLEELKRQELILSTINF